MDEPTSALDPISTSNIEDLMVYLKQHLPSIVRIICNRHPVSDETAFFLHGKVIAFAPTDNFSIAQEKRTEDSLPDVSFIDKTSEYPNRKVFKRSSNMRVTLAMIWQTCIKRSLP